VGARGAASLTLEDWSIPLRNEARATISYDVRLRKSCFGGEKGWFEDPLITAIRQSTTTKK